LFSMSMIFPLKSFDSRLTDLSATVAINRVSATNAYGSTTSLVR
jgi:hypothetical protein